jgi:hypothetical protein
MKDPRQQSEKTADTATDTRPVVCTGDQQFCQCPEHKAVRQAAKEFAPGIGNDWN